MRDDIIRDPAITAGIGQWGAIQGAAPSIGIEVTPVNVRDPAEIERAVAAFARSSDGDDRRSRAGRDRVACVAGWPAAVSVRHSRPPTGLPAWMVISAGAR
jgi:hypothetical protein